MPVPNAHEAVISDAKMRDYILSRSHPVGRFKAAFFARLGFHEENWPDLAGAFREQHLALDPVAETSSAFGTKFEIRGRLRGPAGSAEVVSIWVVLSGDPRPRFVTAYPGAKP